MSLFWKVIPEGSRAAEINNSYTRDKIDQFKRNGHLQKIELLKIYAKKLNCSIGHLALAWCIKNKHVSTVLLGATKPEQIEDNMKSIDIARYVLFR